MLQFPVAILPPRLLQACLLSQAHNTWARECLPTHPYQGRWACHLMVTMATLILSHQRRDRLRRRRRLDMSSLASPCHLSTRPSRMCRTTSDTSVLPVTRIADNLSRWREITFGRERESSGCQRSLKLVPVDNDQPPSVQQENLGGCRFQTTTPATLIWGGHPHIFLFEVLLESIFSLQDF